MNGDRSVPSNFMSDIEYSVIKSDVIKSFDCITAFKYMFFLPQKPNVCISPDVILISTGLDKDTFSA